MAGERGEIRWALVTGFTREHVEILKRQTCQQIACVRREVLFSNDERRCDFVIQARAHCLGEERRNWNRDCMNPRSGRVNQKMPHTVGSAYNDAVPRTQPQSREIPSKRANAAGALRKSKRACAFSIDQAESVWMLMGCRQQRVGRREIGQYFRLTPGVHRAPAIWR